VGGFLILTGVSFLQLDSGEGETRATRVESRIGREELFKKHFITSNTEIAEKTIGVTQARGAYTQVLGIKL
jgi:hypothetical protein